jgi:ubiquinone/menaquinone biosynthesis C-methylase UbiE
MVAAMHGTLTAEEIRELNTRYHDIAATDYDSKWAISFGELGRAQVMAKLQRALGDTPGRYPRALEIGAGTGYFALNMLGAGVIDEATCTDISAGMLATLAASAASLGFTVRTVVADAERLPFPDQSFDLVFGHAVLHHIPDLERAFIEINRLLLPGGTLLFAGEPSRCGDRLAAVPKRLAWLAAPIWRALLRAGPVSVAGEEASHGELEGSVDVHAFDPGELAALAKRTGFQEIRVSGEELLANWFGWANRTLEASAQPDEIPWIWRHYAHRGYLLLQALDRGLLESLLPAALFYNLMISARKAGGQARDAAADTRRAHLGSRGVA